MKYIFIFLLCLLCVNIFAFDITKNGKPMARVIIEENACDIDIYAAEAFVKYIKLISGADLQISHKPAKGNNIYIGRGHSVRKLIKKDIFDKLKKDGIYIYCSGNNLVLTGDEGAGVIYSVYSFLEEYLGVKYITDDEEYIQENKNISVKNISYLYVPPFYSRCSFNGPLYGDKTDFKLKHKQNGRFDGLPKNLGGVAEINGQAHTFLIYMNPKDYGEEHPEWFSYRDGKRITGPETQLCVSNDEMAEELTKNVLKRIEEYPDDIIFSVSQFDNRNYCECDKCKALTEKYGHSGALLRVINKVADSVKVKYPNKYIHFLAYQYTQHLPENIKPADNVIVELCSIECDFSKPFDHNSNKEFMTDLKGWSKLSKQLSVWDYTADFSNFIYPFPNTGILQKNIQILAENKTKLYFAEGDYKNQNAYLLPYKSYIIAKLCWNPYIDIKKETETFLKLYYGPAWEDMYNLIKYTEKAMETSGEILPENRRDTGYFRAKDWTEGFKYLNSAMDKVKDNQKYKDRVYTDLLCWNFGALCSDKNVLLEVKKAGLMPFENKNDISKEIFLWGHGLDYYNEATLIKDSSLKPFDMTKKGNVPDICKNLRNDEWVEWTPEDLENFFKREDVSKLADDPKATKGKARWISSEFKEWWTQEPLEVLKNFEEYKTGEVYVSYRVDMGEKPADSYIMGFYANKTDTKIYVSNTDTPTGEYKTVKIGDIDIENMNTDAYFYVCGNPDALNTSPGLYIDKLFVIMK